MRPWMPLQITVLALATALAAPLGGQTPAAIDAAWLAGVKFREIGPTATGGRVDDFAVGRAPGQPDAIYVATASGGVFKSVNGGVSWTPVFDRVDAMMSIGAIAVARSNPNVVWVGTGEANTRQSSSWGDGVYKSTDAGKTWSNMGLKDTRSIGRIVIDPANPDIVYVAADGHLWGPNAERGVFKTTDGGATWKKTLFVDENTGANDIVIDPGNPQVLYASTYQRERKSWGYNGGGPGSGIYKSTDAGTTWTKADERACRPATRAASAWTSTKVSGEATRRSSTRSSKRRPAAADEERAAAPAERRPPLPVAATAPTPGEAGLYRSVDGGEHWEHLSPLNTRPNYYSQIRVDPKDKNRLYELGSNRGFYVSDDGGKTFKDIFANAPGQSLIHGEDHALWVDPADPQSPHHRRRRRRVDLVGSRAVVGFPQQHAARRSSTRSTSTTKCRSPSAAGCRTTASGACRAPCAIATASRIATPGTSAAATAST